MRVTDSLALGDHRLNGMGTNNVTKNRLSMLNKCLMKIRNAAALAVTGKALNGYIP